MPRIKMVVKDGKLIMDFQEFEGDRCVDEASRIVKKIDAEDVDVKLKYEVSSTHKHEVI